MTLGDKLSKLRKENNFTQEQLADVLGVSRQKNLYATYRTADNSFWSNLARESQQEFKRSAQRVNVSKRGN